MATSKTDQNKQLNQIHTSLTVTKYSGTNPWQIGTSPSFATEDPSGSGSITTDPTTDEVIVASTENTDTYVLLINTGSGSMGNVIVTNDTAIDPLTLLPFPETNIAFLKPKDYLFMPLKALTGMKVKFDTDPTYLEWFHWTRG